MLKKEDITPAIALFVLTNISGCMRRWIKERGGWLGVYNALGYKTPTSAEKAMNKRMAGDKFQLTKLIGAVEALDKMPVVSIEIERETKNG